MSLLQNSIEARDYAHQYDCRFVHLLPTFDAYSLVGTGASHELSLAVAHPEFAPDNERLRRLVRCAPVIIHYVFACAALVQSTHKVSPLYAAIDGAKVRPHLSVHMPPIG